MRDYKLYYEGLEAPLNYVKIFNEISLPVAMRKGCSDYEISRLIKRPYFLSSLAEDYSCTNIAEVGTAEGLQFYSFAESLSSTKGKVWSCDVRDARNTAYSDRFPQTCHFVRGTSKTLSSELKKQEAKIDMFFIDGGHNKGDVVKDISNLKEFQSESPIWVFDDYDTRFGIYIYEEIRGIENTYQETVRINQSTKDKPNHMLIAWEKMK